MPNYPAQIDTLQSLPTAVDNLTPVYGAIFNRLRDAVIAIETELGVKPSGSYGTLGARLITLENAVGNLQIIELEGDLGGTLATPRVISIQGLPITTIVPHLNDVLTWNGIAWTPEPTQNTGGGGGGFTPPAGSAPGQTLIWNGTTYVPTFYEQDDVVPPLLVALSGPIFAEVNQTLTHPAFTAAYTTTPSSATLKDNVNNITQVVTSTPHAFTSNYSFQKTTFGDSVTFTLTATEGHVTKTSQVVTTWGQNLYWGPGPVGQSGASFITSLVGKQVTLDKLFSFNILSTAGQYIYFACRHVYGPVTFTVNGMQGGFSLVGTYSVTNDYGFTDSYDLYVSDNENLGNCYVFTGNGNDEFAIPGGPVGAPGPMGPQGPAGPAGLPTGPAGGDLSGTYPNPIVSTIGGNIPITEATSATGDVSGTFPNLTVSTINGNIPITEVTSATGDVSGTFPALTVSGINGVTVSGTPTSGQTIIANSFSSASWGSTTGVINNIVNVTSSYTATPMDDLIVVGTRSSGCTITLPSGGMPVGKQITIRDGSGQAGNINRQIGISGTIDSTIFILNTFGIKSNGQSWTLVWNGTYWEVINIFTVIDLAGATVGAYVNGGSWHATQNTQLLLVRTASYGASTIYLPATSTLMPLEITVKDFEGNAASTNITVNGNGQLIDGAASQVINTNWGFLKMITNGFDWFIVAKG